ncbi:MAG: hypothetical protein ACREFZ_03560 [Acetobacteraceae bacterium]
MAERFRRHFPTLKVAVAAFGPGAQAERIRATGRGWLLPLGLSASALNEAHLALVSLARP